MNMKKILAIVVAVFALCSCSKTCNCVSKVDDQVITEWEQTLSDGQKCADFNASASVLNHGASIRCKAAF